MTQYLLIAQGTFVIYSQWLKAILHTTVWLLTIVNI